TNLDKPLLIDDNVATTINLDGKSITTESAWCIFRIYGDKGSLTLKGTGTLTNKAPGESTVIGVNQGALTIDETSNIKLEATSADEGSYGISIYQTAQTETKVNNSEISAQNGIYVNGNLTPETGSTLDLNNVKIDAKGHGIYQAGSATTTITGEDTNIKGGAVGIEVRAGNLTVFEGAISGSPENPLKVEGNGNGSTTLNAGVAIAQHTTGAKINVTLGKDGKAPTVSGYVGLAITDPQNKQEGKTNFDEDITVEVDGATLEGASDGWGVAYSTDTIAFTLKNTVCQSIQKVNAGGTAFTDEIDPLKIPYKVILELNNGDEDQPATISSDVLATFAKVGEEEGSQVVTITLQDVPLPLSYADLPLDSFKEEGLSEATLGGALTAQSSQEVEIVDHKGKMVNKAPGYTYTVSNLTKLEDSSKGIEVKGEPEVKIQVEEDSVVKFVLPKEETQNDEILPMLEVEENLGETPEESSNEPTSDLYVDVKESGKTAATINAYLLTQANDLEQTVHVDPNLDLSEAITLGNDG
ncbi:MAG: hypothetical protein K2H85_03805, partial [Allobaculum sp.]|nr:hypothetical protein [Allobaculum sp.]